MCNFRVSAGGLVSGRLSPLTAAGLVSGASGMARRRALPRKRVPHLIVELCWPQIAVRPAQHRPLVSKEESMIIRTDLSFGSLARCDQAWPSTRRSDASLSDLSRRGLGRKNMLPKDEGRERRDRTSSGLGICCEVAGPRVCQNHTSSQNKRSPDQTKVHIRFSAKQDGPA